MPKRKKLRLGNSDFKSIIESDAYYIDKSLFIKEIIEAEKDVLLLPRPRRFGKTLNLSMLRYFFDVREAENKNLFKNLKIWHARDHIKSHYCKFPVVYLTFKDAKSQKWLNCLSHIKLEIARVFRQYRDILAHNILYEEEKAKFTSILNETANEVDFEASLQLLSEFLYRFYKQKVIILIDEYDAPIQSGYKNYYPEVISFMRNLLSGAFKDNPFLYRGVLSGILRISKESIFSGLNNLGVYSILHSRFSDKFGFTTSEVEQIVKDFEIEPNYNNIKLWYNGYQFGQTSNIYNPWSILNYVVDHQEGFLTYWASTSSDELIKQLLLKRNATHIREDLFKLVNNELIKKEIEENFVFPDLGKKQSLVWTLFAYSGYVTLTNKISTYEYELQIPNYEIKTIFQRTILEWLEADVKLQKIVLLDTIKYLLGNQIEDFEKGFKEIIGDTFSYYDSAKNHEYVYQSYTLGLLAIIGDEYIIKSNRESGQGRYDIMLVPRPDFMTTNNGVVIEIKQIQPQDKNEPGVKFHNRINKALQEASNQIIKFNYVNELKDYGLKVNQIVTVPIVFAGKEPFCTPR